MNFYEWCAAVICLTAILVMLLFSWIFGRDDCNGNCEQDRRCRCQKESLK